MHSNFNISYLRERHCNPRPPGKIAIAVAISLLCSSGSKGTACQRLPVYLNVNRPQALKTIPIANTTSAAFVGTGPHLFVPIGRAERTETGTGRPVGYPKHQLRPRRGGCASRSRRRTEQSAHVSRRRHRVSDRDWRSTSGAQPTASQCRSNPWRQTLRRSAPHRA